jgi:hypothetical protein
MMEEQDQPLSCEDRFTFQLDRFKEGIPVETVQKILGGGIGHCWPDLVQDFLDFLRGCGYQIPNVLPMEADEVNMSPSAPKPRAKRRKK